MFQRCVDITFETMFGSKRLKKTLADDTVDGRNPANHCLGCIKPWKSWDKLPINWCKISSINSMMILAGQEMSRSGSCYRVELAGDKSCRRV